MIFLARSRFFLDNGVIDLEHVCRRAGAVVVHAGYPLWHRVTILHAGRQAGAQAGISFMDELSEKGGGMACGRRDFASWRFRLGIYIGIDLRGHVDK